MVVTRSGKNTSIYKACVHECGHMCGSSMVYCCACNDIRPMQATYIAHNKSYLSQGSYVNRSYYYCPTCKTAPPPVKIDFSGMKSKPASDPALFRPTPSPEQRIDILKTLNAELRKMYETSENTAVGLRTEIKFLEAELQEMNDRLKYLTERIKNPFKSAISRPNF